MLDGFLGGAIAGLAVLCALALPARAGGVDPSAAGDFAVGVRTLVLEDASRSRELVTEAWYPATSEGRDAAPRRGHHPLVLLAHGHCGFRTNYEFLSVALASFGFVVVAPDFPGFTQADCDAPQPSAPADPLGDLAFLSATLRDRGGPASALAHAVRRRGSGLVGHSLGGLVALTAAVADPDVRAVVAVAPFADAVQGEAFVGLRPRRAVLAIGGGADASISFEGGTRPLFEALPSPAFLLRIAGGTHSGFTDVDAGLSAEALARQQALTRRYAVAFLRRYLARDHRFRRVLTAADAAARGSDVELEARPR